MEINVKEGESERMKEWVVRPAINQGYVRENVELKGYEFRVNVIPPTDIQRDATWPDILGKCRINSCKHVVPDQSERISRD